MDTATLPRCMTRLQTDRHGRPVPWFTPIIDGVPDPRLAEPDRVTDALNLKLSWVCGGPRGANMAFVLGPMCALNRTTAEPPSHRDCAIYAATHCPFLTTPQMVRRDRGKPAHTPAAGTMLTRNPGVTLVWITRSFRPYLAPVDGGGLGVLIEVGDPTDLIWYARGRQATRDEVIASIDSGMPLLRQSAEQEGTTAELDAQHQAVMQLVPAV